MKIKGLGNKRVFKLNKTTIVNLNHREMVKIKVGAYEDGIVVKGGSGVLDSSCCNTTHEIPDPRTCLSFATECVVTVEPVPTSDTC